MQILTDLNVSTAGADTVLSVTRSERNQIGGNLVGSAADTIKSVTILAPFKLGTGDPATDGTILNQCYFDTDSGRKWINSAWPVTATPTWEEI